jgi:hypothetical protein
MKNSIELSDCVGCGISGMRRKNHGRNSLGCMITRTYNSFFSQQIFMWEMVRTLPSWRQGGYMVLLPRSCHLSYTWYKLGIVENELMNSNWMKNLKEITTESRLHEFVLLFMALAL